jgi:type 1 fimbria pilin
MEHGRCARHFIHNTHQMEKHTMEMKSVLKTTALSVLMMTAMTAQAVPVNTTLTVKGTITPAACVPTLANNGVIDFGEISAGRLPASGSLTLEAKSLTATVTCASAASVAMTFKDNRADTVLLVGGETTKAEQAFGLGKSNDINIGSYGIKITQITGDSADGVVLHSSDKEVWSRLASTEFVNNNTVPQYLTFGLSGNNAPKEAKLLTFELQVTPALNSALKDISQAVNIDGNATLSFEYL